MKKAIAAIVLCVALTLCMSLSAFAEVSSTSDYIDLSPCFTLSTAEIYGTNEDGTHSWFTVNNIVWQYNPNDWSADTERYFYNLRFGGAAYRNFPYMGFRLPFVPRYENTGTEIPSGHYLSFKISCYDDISIGSYLDGFCSYFSVVVYAKDGRIWSSRCEPSIRSDTGYWEASILQKIGTGEEPVSIAKVVVESDMPSGGGGNVYYTLNVALSASDNVVTEPDVGDDDSSDTDSTVDAINGATDKIIANDNANTDKITDSVGDAADDITANQDANTNKIIENENANHEDLKNGWDSPDGDPAGDVDDLTGNMGDAEDAALGGKSDEEIQAELTGLISSNSFPGPTSSGMVSSLFDDMLKAFGPEYQAVLILSLILGLAAFLVGRQYRAKGD